MFGKKKEIELRECKRCLRVLPINLMYGRQEHVTTCLGFRLSLGYIKKPICDNCADNISSEAREKAIDEYLKMLDKRQEPVVPFPLSRIVGIEEDLQKIKITISDLPKRK